MIIPRPGSRSYVDPVVWARTVAPFAVPIAPEHLGPSGTASPLFNLLDSLFQRPTQRSQLGQEILGHRAAYPQNWRRFLTAVDAIGLGPYVERTGHPRLTGALAAALEAYAGQTGFLSRHRRKVFGYLEIAFKVGRGVTIGGFSGAPQDRTWIQVDGELERSQRERGAVVPMSTATLVRPTPDVDGGSYPLSELVLHNDEEHGYWISIDGEVYDVSEFLRRHPGGPIVLAGYAGLDATQAYHRLHSKSAAAATALRRCRIGRMNTPRWAGALARAGSAGGSHYPPARLANNWSALLTSVVEMQNASRQDDSLRRGVGLSRASEEPRSPYLLERNVDTFERFVTHYLRPINDAAADHLWPATIGAFPDAASPVWLRQRIDQIWVGASAATLAALPGDLRDRLRTSAAGAAGPQPAEFRRIEAICERLTIACAAYLGEL
jgi:predicted heme/steroid binding protein